MGQAELWILGAEKGRLSAPPPALTVPLEAHIGVVMVIKQEQCRGPMLDPGFL